MWLKHNSYSMNLLPGSIHKMTANLASDLHSPMWTLTYTLWVLNSYLLTTSRIKVNYVDGNMLSSSVL